jgi:hypothetical protein
MKDDRDDHKSFHQEARAADLLRPDVRNLMWGGFLLVVGSGGFASTSWQTDARFPFAILAMLAGPSVTGVLLTSLVDGKAGLRDVLRRLFKWRVSAGVALACLRLDQRHRFRGALPRRLPARDAFVLLTLFRVLMVCVYDRTGSLLVAMFMHGSLTASARIRIGGRSQWCPRSHGRSDRASEARCAG